MDFHKTSSICRFSEVIRDEDFAEGGDREPQRGCEKRKQRRTIVTCAGGAHDGGEEGVGEHRAPVHHQLEVRATTCLKTFFCKPANLIEVHSSDLPKTFFNMIKIAYPGVKGQFQCDFK